MSFVRLPCLAAALLFLRLPLPILACDLCAVYSADNARDQTRAGFVFSLSESYIPYGTVQLDGTELTGANLDFRDTSITHLVPGFNFTRRFGLNLNIPLIDHRFQRTEVRYSTNALPFVRTERAEEFGVGDLSLIGRFTVVEKAKMNYGFALNLLAGIKFPTGDSDRIADEVEQTRIFDSFLPPGTPHDPLGHSISGVHQHDLARGSGSFDGIFGLAFRSRWQRLFLNGQFQYYLRTEGESTFQYGDEIMISGGPGAYLVAKEKCSLNLQANFSYDTMARDRLLERISERTGLTAWYLGPQVGLTIGQRFSGVAGIDLPLRVSNRGLQNVPDYRFHATLAWRF